MKRTLAAVALLLGTACATVPVATSYDRCLGPAPESRVRPVNRPPRDFRPGEWARARLLNGRTALDPDAEVEIAIRNLCGWPIGALDWVIVVDTIPVLAYPTEPTVLRARIGPETWRRLPPVFGVSASYGAWGATGSPAAIFEIVKRDVTRGRNLAHRTRAFDG